MSGKRVGIIEMLICAVLWSTGGICIKFVPWNPMVLSGMRSLVAGLVIGGYMVCKRINFVFCKKSFASGVALACTYSFFVTANKLTTAANAIVLQFSAPVFIVILSAVFLHTKFSRRDLYAVFFTMVGIAMFFLDQLSFGDMLGNVVAILSGVAMASMYIINGEIDYNERMSALVIAQAMCFVLALVFIAAGETPELSTKAVSSILFLGAVQLGLPYILYAKAAAKCSALVCCLIGAIEPLLNPLWVFLFDGERPGRMAIIGGTIVVLTVTVWNVLSGKDEKQEVA